MQKQMRYTHLHTTCGGIARIIVMQLLTYTKAQKGVAKVFWTDSFNKV